MYQIFFKIASTQHPETMLKVMGFLNQMQLLQGNIIQKKFLVTIIFLKILFLPTSVTVLEKNFWKQTNFWKIEKKEKERNSFYSLLFVNSLNPILHELIAI